MHVLEHLRRNAIAYLALFVALGGTGAWAAAQIDAKDVKRNAVRSKHVKNGQVKARDAELVRVRRVGGEQQVSGSSGTGDQPIRVAAKPGDLLLVQASVTGRRVSGAGQCRVNLLEDVPGAGGSQNVPVIAFEEFADPGSFHRAYLAEDTFGTTVHNEAQARMLPILDGGAYELKLVLRADTGTTCAYRDRTLLVSLIR